MTEQLPIQNTIKYSEFAGMSVHMPYSLKGYRIPNPCEYCGHKLEDHRFRGVDARDTEFAGIECWNNDCSCVRIVIDD
jgi:hypothetical protein